MDLSANDIMRMFQGYQITSILKAGIELGIFDYLAKGLADAPSIATAIGASERGTRILLDALGALGVVESHKGMYRLTPVADTHLVKGRSAYLGDLAYILVSKHFWERYRQLPEAVRRGGTMMEDHAETPGHPFWEDFAVYSSVVAGQASEILANILAPWASSRQPLEVLDVACGTGLYGYTLAKYQPHARVWSLDWPNVLSITRNYAERLGILDRVRFIEGDMFEVPLKGPYDLILVSHVFHHFSKERCTQLLHRFAGALKPDGRIAIHDFIPGEASPRVDAFSYLFSVLMLVWTREGEAHSLDSYRQMLVATGFTSPFVFDSEAITSRILIADRVL